MTDPIAILAASEKADPPPSTLVIEGLDLSFRGFDGARTLRLHASGVVGRGSSWRGAYFDEPLLDGASFPYSAFEDSFMFEAALGGSDSSHANLRNVQWLSCFAPESIFDDADLTGARLDGTIFPGASFRGACLRGASLVHCSFRGCDLTGADLRGGTLTDTVFEGAKLTGVLLDDGIHIG